MRACTRDWRRPTIQCGRRPAHSHLHCRRSLARSTASSRPSNTRTSGIVPHARAADPDGKWQCTRVRPRSEIPLSRQAPQCMNPVPKRKHRRAAFVDPGRRGRERRRTCAPCEARRTMRLRRLRGRISRPGEASESPGTNRPPRTRARWTSARLRAGPSPCPSYRRDCDR
ncbi:MAG: hypothetical protein RL385_488 [Pseudomonadota bacterium]